MRKSMMRGKIGLVAGRGTYPALVLQGAKDQGVSLAVAAFEGETDPRVATRGQPTHWLRVGQLGGLITFFKKTGVGEVIFAGQIAPKRLFDLRPDLRALWILSRLKERNAETLFGAVAKELAQEGIKVLPATTFVEEHLAGVGHLRVRVQYVIFLRKLLLDGRWPKRLLGCTSGKVWWCARGRSWRWKDSMGRMPR